MRFEKIAVLGSGGWGTALAGLVAAHGGEVVLWARDPGLAVSMRTSRQNSRHLPGVELPRNIRPVSDLADCADAGLVLMAVPSLAVRGTAVALAKVLDRRLPVLVSCTKGIESGSGLLMSQVISSLLPGSPVAALSGPNLAPEVAAGIPAAGVIGCETPSLCADLQSVLSTRTFRTYTSDDLAGVQLGGALKNIFAIAAGVSDGFGMGDNAKAALVTRSLAEMTRLGCAMGGQRETFSGLSGTGDLMVTCFSRQSRNRQFGERLGRGESPSGILASTPSVAEGVPTSRSAMECARRLGIDVPILSEVFAVLHEGKPPRESLACLLGRPPKPECDR